MVCTDRAGSPNPGGRANRFHAEEDEALRPLQRSTQRASVADPTPDAGRRPEGLRGRHERQEIHVHNRCFEGNRYARSAGARGPRNIHRDRRRAQYELPDPAVAVLIALLLTMALPPLFERGSVSAVSCSDSLFRVLRFIPTHVGST